jgi:hypothetical protein
MAHLSSRSWKLSAALIALAGTAQADEQSPAFAHALYCTAIAATVYAQMTDESAETIASVAPQKCWDKWKLANAELSRMALARTEKSIGRKIRPEEVSSLPMLNAADENVTNEIKLRVMDWRSQAKMGNAQVYENTRKDMQAKDQAIR